ncbi:MAG: MoxR family ATPase [bacterium]
MDALLTNPAPPDASWADYVAKIQAIRSEIGKVVIGQEEMIRLMIHTFLAKGHVLLEGVPGLAKSLAVETFAKVVGGRFNRFQFTPDKMPGDITGTTVYNEHEKKFDYIYGPIFCNIFLADEINRASPKVQSALLQAMQEREVAIDCMNYKIPNPFIVLATQNPIEQIGTYPLAESQVDRFMVKYDVGYPDKEEEADLIRRKNTDFEETKSSVRQIVTPADVLQVQRLVHDQVRVGRKVMEYILNLCISTRPSRTYRGKPRDSDFHKFIRLGASPRATESLLALSKACAFYQGNEFVSFEDVNRCAVHVLRHRILLTSAALSNQISSDWIVDEILKTVQAY